MTSKNRIVIAGGTGFVGHHLTVELTQAGYQVEILSRSRHDPPNFHRWHLQGDRELAQILDGALAVINLTGEPIADKRWSKSQKNKILSSRVSSTHAINTAIPQCETPPECFINASAVGFYGAEMGPQATEETPAGTDFVAAVCQSWEKAVGLGSGPSRKVILRIGLVVGPDGGLLSKMLLPFKLGIGGPLGSGKQLMPWIHVSDIAAMIHHIIKSPNITGVYNAVSPNPVDNNTFSKSLGKALRRPSFARVPAFILKIILGELAQAVLGGRAVSARKIQDTGYTFKYPDLPDALNAAIKK